ncbi:hypothetical protein ZIOFF_051971 [Zingiber officinale]|uniref:SBP-type domain-containing protein n=2 Tax=Zingiber officinale TaxID=94328 RepID=A0A8J5FUE1_ZINOF|nr:hypothetical protein ZIOFF_051971 [Zingiber officinale]
MAKAFCVSPLGLISTYRAPLRSMMSRSGAVLPLSSSGDGEGQAPAGTAAAPLLVSLLALSASVAFPYPPFILPSGDFYWILQLREAFCELVGLLPSFAQRLMEWSSSKVPYWDMAELEQGAELNVGALAGPSFVLGSQSGGLVDCSVDLRLGGLGEFGPPERWLPVPASTAAAAAAAVPSRRARAGSNAGASCLVDGCKSDLSNSREYHRRHKVCEVHSKTPMVMVGGQEQRFCQQCSRFHQLLEFDEVKRSCRKRLDGHNRRRRKPQPESINPGSLFPNTQGGSFLMYPPPPPHGIPSPTQGHSTWSGIDSQQCFSASSSTKNIKQFSFMQDDSSRFSQPTFHAMFKATSTAESGSGSSSSKVLAGGVPPEQILDSDCALSLLSAAQGSGGIGVGQLLPAGRIPVHRPLVSDLTYAAARPSSYASVQPVAFSCFDDPEGNVFVCEAETGLQCQCVFNAMGGAGSSGEASQALPFPWQ